MKLIFCFVVWVLSPLYCVLTSTTIHRNIHLTYKRWNTLSLPLLDILVCPCNTMTCKQFKKESASVISLFSALTITHCSNIFHLPGSILVIVVQLFNAYVTLDPLNRTYFLVQFWPVSPFVLFWCLTGP